MKVLLGVLEEEKDRIQSLSISWKKKAAALPKGSVAIRKIGSQKYAYLYRWEKGKVKSEYLGRADSVRVREVGAQVAERRHYEESLRRFRDELKILKKVLNAKRRKS